MKLRIEITSIKVEKGSYGRKHYIIEGEDIRNQITLRLDDDYYKALAKTENGLMVDDVIEIEIPGSTVVYDDSVDPNETRSKEEA